MTEASREQWADALKDLGASLNLKRETILNGPDMRGLGLSYLRSGHGVCAKHRAHSGDTAHFRREV